MEWFFFDCFNTLLDDFDPSGSEAGLGTLPERAVALGACASRQQFLDTYQLVRPSLEPEHREHSLEDRLSGVLSRIGAVAAEQQAAAVAELLAFWHAEYPTCLRVTPGAREMLARWQGKRRMGVVSNFFVAGQPQAYLRQFGLAQHFEFVLDSAALGHRKPGRRIFEEALARAEATPERVTFIGDRLDLDIIPAHALGMSVLHLDRSGSRPGSIPRDPRFPFIEHYDELRVPPGSSARCS